MRGRAVQAGESRKVLPYTEPPTNTDSSVFSRILKLITDEKQTKGAWSDNFTEIYQKIRKDWTKLYG